MGTADLSAADAKQAEYNARFDAQVLARRQAREQQQARELELIREVIASRETVVVTPEEPTELRIAAYRSMLRRMDWSFEFSDDGQKWAAGCQALKQLQEEQRRIDPDRVIWNEERGVRGFGEVA